VRLGETGQGWVMLGEVGRGWMVQLVSGQVRLVEVGCGWFKWVKVYHTGSGQVVNKDGHRELAIPVLTV
jgi:uncharacterized iron-regulated membrane protein